MTPLKIGIGGGVFDPIHVGHLFLFNECADRLALDRVLLIPTFQAVHKVSDQMSDYRHRREMVQRACMHNPRFEMSEIEKETGGPSYTIDTIRVLKEKYSGAEMYFLVGLDNLEKMEDWYHPDKIVREATVVVGSRPVNSNVSRSKFKDDVMFLDIPMLDISSTDIRDRVRAGRSIKYMVTREIEEYIAANRLYQQ